MEALDETRGAVTQSRGAGGAGLADPAAGGGQHGQRCAAEPGFFLRGDGEKNEQFKVCVAWCRECVKVSSRTEASFEFSRRLVFFYWSSD